jgi:hypothetical protein
MVPQKKIEIIKEEPSFRNVEDDGINTDSDDEEENGITASLNDRDSSEDTESMRHPELLIHLGQTLNRDPYPYPATQVRPDSETLKYTNSENSSS